MTMNSVFIEKKCDTIFCGSYDEFKSSFSDVDYYNTIITREIEADKTTDVFKRQPSFLEFKNQNHKTPQYVIYAAQNSVCSQFITINLKNSDFTRFLIIAKESSDFKLFINSDDLKDRSYTFVISADRNSSVEVVGLNSNSENLLNFLYIEQNEGSIVKSHSVNYGVKNVKNFIKCSMNAKNIESHFYGVSLIGAHESIENNTIVGHIKEKCNSTQHYKAVVAPEGKSLFRGRIYVAKDAQKSEAFQQSNNILLGDGAIARNLPQLEIYADDVKCSHGSTTGELDSEAIFYMRQRGISTQEAKRLQISGFVSDLITKISSEELTETILEKVTHKLSTI